MIRFNSFKKNVCFCISSCKHNFPQNALNTLNKPHFWRFPSKFFIISFTSLTGFIWFFQSIFQSWLFLFHQANCQHQYHYNEKCNKATKDVYCYTLLFSCSFFLALNKSMNYMQNTFPTFLCLLVDLAISKHSNYQSLHILFWPQYLHFLVGVQQLSFHLQYQENLTSFFCPLYLIWYSATY